MVPIRSRLIARRFSSVRPAVLLRVDQCQRWPTRAGRNPRKAASDRDAELPPRRKKALQTLIKLTRYGPDLVTIRPHGVDEQKLSCAWIKMGNGETDVHNDDQHPDLDDDAAGPAHQAGQPQRQRLGTRL